MSVTEEVFARWDSEDTHWLGKNSSKAAYGKIAKEASTIEKGQKKQAAAEAAKIKKLTDEISVHVSQFTIAKKTITTAYTDLSDAVKNLKVTLSPVSKEAQRIVDSEDLQSAINLLKADIASSSVSSMNNKAGSRGY